MTIRVVRNDAGNCVNFYGTSNPTYWNACLVALPDPTYPNLISVKNEIRSVEEGEDVFEFYQLPFDLFVKADGSAFVDRDEAVEYISEAAHVIGNTGTFILSDTDTLAFEKTVDGTTILVDTGDSFALASIRAERVGETIKITDHAAKKDLFTNMVPSQMTFGGSALSSDLDSAVNQLNAYFIGVSIGAGAVTHTPTTIQVGGDDELVVFYYIESPDGAFTYPLFADVESAELYNQSQGYGTGSTSVHVFADDPTGYSWVASQGAQFGVQFAPIHPDINYNEIPTEADENFAPGPVSFPDLRFNEGTFLNSQLIPQDVAYSVSVSGLPAGLVFNGTDRILGTAPAVTEDTDYTITVTRANNYGSVVDTFTLTIVNVVYTGDPIDGFSHVAGSANLDDEDTMASGSVVTIDTQVGEGERMIIRKEWVEQYVLPRLQGAAGAEVIIGILSANPTLSDISVSDFSHCFRWNAESPNQSTNWYLGAYHLGNSVGTRVSINGHANGQYDAVISNVGGVIEFNTLSQATNPVTENVPRNDAGGFWTVSTSHTQAPGPLTIAIAVDGVVLDLANAGIDVVAEPVVASVTTSWTKALDFSGSSERAQMVSTSTLHNAIMMGNVAATVSAHTSFTSGTHTSNRADSRPWACACVFNADGYGANQHIWNVGEGSGSNDDNIYLRLSAARQLFFGWGREGALNELYIGSIAAGWWYGVYVGHTGQRLSGSDATPANLAKCFDVKLMAEPSDFNTLFDEGSEAGWNNANSTTGGRMDRNVVGATTIGGRGANRSFRGKVASMVVTTLKTGDLMPADEEIRMMIRDPQQWLTDYKVGETYRLPGGTANYGPFSRNSSGSAYATQVWLMGDGPNDGYAQIRNDVYPTIQNVYPLNMISMVSNDIQTVNIQGLS